jgi:hypothetical protein
MFTLWDTNGDGKLDQEELMKCFQKCYRRLVGLFVCLFVCLFVVDDVSFKQCLLDFATKEPKGKSCFP